MEQLKRAEKISEKKLVHLCSSLPLKKQIEFIWLKCYKIRKTIMLSNPITAIIVNRVVVRRPQDTNLGNIKGRSYWNF